MIVPSPVVAVSTGLPMDTAISLDSLANVSCTVDAPITSELDELDEVFIQGKVVLGTKQTEKAFTYKLNPATTTYMFNHTITNVSINDGGVYNCTASLIYNGSNDFILNSSATSSSSPLYISSKLYKFKLRLTNTHEIVAVLALVCCPLSCLLIPDFSLSLVIVLN